MNKTSVVFSFIAGLSIGSAVTWFYAKKRYEEIIENEVSSARETYNQLGKELIEKNNMLKDKMFKELDKELSKDLKEYEEIIDNQEYDDSSADIQEEHEIQEKPSNPYTPYEISDTEYGSDDSYNLVSLTYYSDGIITDDLDEVIDDAESILGDDIYEVLEKYDSEQVNSCYFRNDVRRSDYEILLARYNFNS